MNEPINFYHIGEPFGEFSNFAAFPIELDGLTWPTSEHYFQAQKFTNSDYKEQIRMTKSPSIAARLGRSKKVPLRDGWDKLRDEVMYEAVKAKFQQHEELRVMLLSTGDRKLVEHTQNDSYWGDGGDGTGKNMLGRTLMRLRCELAGK